MPQGSGTASGRNTPERPDAAWLGTASGRNAPERPDAAWLGTASGRNAPERPDAARLGDHIRQERAGAPRCRMARHRIRQERAGAPRCRKARGPHPAGTRRSAPMPQGSGRFAVFRALVQPERSRNKKPPSTPAGQERTEGSVWRCQRYILSSPSLISSTTA